MDNNAGTEALLHEAIRENLKKIKGNIEKACREGGHHKNPDDVTIVGVTKTFGAGTVKAAIAAGIVSVQRRNRVPDAVTATPFRSNG